MANEFQKQQVDLYYLGGLNDDVSPQYMTTGGDAYLIPPVGESIRIEMYKAEDLMRKYNVHNNTFLSLAKPGTPSIAAMEAKPLTSYSRDELLMALSRMAAAPVAETPVDFGNEPDAHPQEPAEIVDVPPQELPSPDNEAALKAAEADDDTEVFPEHTTRRPTKASKAK